MENTTNPGVKPGEPEISRCCNISTAHISPETNNLLLESIENQEELPIFLPKKVDGEIYGFIFLITGYDDVELSSTPADLCACLEYAANLNCDMLMLDCDSPVVDDLPTYAWP